MPLRREVDRWLGQLGNPADSALLGAARDALTLASTRSAERLCPLPFEGASSYWSAGPPLMMRVPGVVGQRPMALTLAQ